MHGGVAAPMGTGPSFRGPPQHQPSHQQVCAVRSRRTPRRFFFPVPTDVCVAFQASAKLVSRNDDTRYVVLYAFQAGCKRVLCCRRYR